MTVPAPQTLTLPRPDDWHVHLRSGAMMRAVLAETAARFGRAIIMPNLRPPIVTTAQARAYRDEILAALPAGARFTPLMTAYATEETDPNDVADGFGAGVLTAVKLYPAHATTNSEHGVQEIARIRPLLERLERIGMPLLVHGEVTDPGVDVFDREAVFVNRVLAPLLADHPGLRVVLEHITSAEGVDFVRAHADSGRIAGTITVHHLMINRNALFQGGLRPHAYCLPVAKREHHRLALVDAATSGEPEFFLGTDSAPHPIPAKESACGCAGIFTAAGALEFYACAFEQAGALDKLEGFASRHGPAFYRLPVSADTVTLERAPWGVPERVVSAEGDSVMPFRAGETLGWRLRG